MSDIETTIVNDVLPAIEDDLGATILMARDYGSHDAILMNPESDRDIAFLAAHPPTSHAHVEQPTDRFAYEETINGTDVHLAGFSLARFARDVASSDPKALTLVSAETEYMLNDAITSPLTRLFEHIESSFHPPALIAHYRQLARSNYAHSTSDDWEYNGGGGPQWTIRRRGAARYLVTGILGYDEHETEQPVEEAIEKGVLEHREATPTVQQNLRIARTLLSAQYVYETGEFPPSEFEALVDARVDETVDTPPVPADPVGDSPPPLPQSTAGTLRELADQKRAGRGDEPIGFAIDEWAAPIVTADVFSVNTNHIAQELRENPTATSPDRHPDSEQVNDCVDQITEDLFLS